MTETSEATGRPGTDPHPGTDRPGDLRPGERILAALRSRTAMVVVLALVLAGIWWAGEAHDVSRTLLLSLAVWGVMLGGIIGLGGIGLTLVYGVLKFPNFSHGALVTLGAYRSEERRVGKEC